MSFNLKIATCLLLSFIVYLFPIPGLHITEIWGEVIMKAWQSNLTTLISLSLLFAFAISYQLFVVFCFYKISLKSFSKRIMLSLPLIAGLYILLVIGIYIVGFVGMAVEQTMGISPV